MSALSRTIVITGASSGLGAALAVAWAAPHICLHLAGRNSHALQNIAEQCRHLGALVHPYVIDVTDGEAMRHWLTGLDARTPIDLLIANAGISAGTGGGEEGEPQTRQIMAVNVDGVMNTILPVLPAMQARKQGHIAIMSSLAGFRGMPGAPAYCASKAMVRVWGEGLRGWLAPQGITVSVICPGFVRTPMTDRNRFPMPFMISPEEAAQRIKRGLDAGRGRIAFPLPMLALSWLAAALPDWLMGRISRAMPGKDP